MRIFRLIFTCFLSLAILSVGSAAVAMSVNGQCPMQQMQAEQVKMAMPDTSSMMMSMQMDDSQTMPHMDCMKVEKTHTSNTIHCKSGQDCVMYSVQLAYPASNITVSQPNPQHLNSQHYIDQSSDFVPTPDLFGLWRPPRAL